MQFPIHVRTSACCVFLNEYGDDQVSSSKESFKCVMGFVIPVNCSDDTFPWLSHASIVSSL